MKALIKNTLYALLCLAIVGNAACTSMQTIDGTANAVQEETIKPGDEVILLYVDGSITEITVTSVTESDITGVDMNGDTITAAYADVETVSFTAVDGGKTAKNTAKAVGFVALIAIVAGAAAVSAMDGFTYH